MEPNIIRNKKEFNKQKMIIVVLVIITLSIFIGTSYSLLTSFDETEEVISFQAGDLNLEVKTNNDTIVELEDELPKSEDEVQTPIILNLKNTGSLTICEYRLKLISDTTQTSDLPINFIRYSISEDNGVTYKESKLLSETSNQIYIGFDLKSNGTKTIYLKVWLDESALDNEEVLNKSFYGKIDAELLQRCEAPATEHIKATMGETGGIIGVTNDNLKVTEETSNIREYRYSGLGVNNYVTFNNEPWRIIGVFKDEAGAEHLKIVRNEVLKRDVFPETYEANGETFNIQSTSSGDYAYWNLKLDNTFNSNWADSGLMNWLNSTGTEKGYLKTLSQNFQSMISDTEYKLGNVPTSEDTAIQAYEHERGSTTCSGSCSGGDIWNGNSATWTGKIALMYPSDYGFSTDSSNWPSNMYNWSDSQLNSTWLKEGHTTHEWFLSPTSYFGANTVVADWNIKGNVRGDYANFPLGIRPCLYLNSDISITSGSGSSIDPYILG